VNALNYREVETNATAKETHLHRNFHRTQPTARFTSAMDHSVTAENLPVDKEPKPDPRDIPSH
jgi:hypothetical protein